jgi:hypothetical protein
MQLASLAKLEKQIWKIASHQPEVKFATLKVHSYSM